MRKVGPRTLAAVSLDARGGGVAAASRLIWRSVHDRWGGESALLTLLNGRDALTAGRKLRFGSRAIRAQVFGGVRWILFSHLGLARVQAILPAGLQRPYGVFLHGVEVWRPLPESDKRVLRHAALRLANSAYTAQRVATLHPDIGPVLACPLALPPEREAAAAAPDVATDADGPLALMVGRMDAGEAYKGHAEAIAAWPRVLQTCPAARLVIVGKGDDAARLRALADASPAAARIAFTGFVEDAALDQLYRHASVFLMPSRGEGFGIVYLEAMAHGLPCIGSRHDAAGDVIEDGVTGFLVAQDQVAEIADRTVRLMTDPALRQRMGEAGHRRFRETFSFARFSSRLLGLIEEYLES
jgi:phosphatidyl-myo-inositol dimannoside synthase